MSLQPRWFQNQWLAGAALVVLAIAAYIPALAGKFIWDDVVMVVTNPLVTSAGGLAQIWVHPKPDPYPITLTALWLQWHLGGGGPLIFHVVSVLTHAVGALLFWRLLLRLAVPAAWFIAALFTVHPVCVASVGWITEQKNTISLIFYLLTFLFYLRYDETAKKTNYWLAFVAFICALLSKGSTVIAPAVLALFIWWRPRESPQQSRRYIGLIPFFIAAAADAILVVLSQDKNAIGFVTVQPMSGLEHALAAAREVWLYAWKDIAPVNLAAVYSQWRVHPNQALAYLPLLGLCVVAAICWWYRKSWGASILFGLAAFLISLLPVLGFIDMAFLMYSRTADHLQYLALLASLPVIVVAARFCFEKFINDKNVSASATRIAAAAVLAGCFVLTWERAGVYTTDERLWTDTLRKYPDAWIGCVNMGHFYFHEKRYPQAIEMYSRAAAVDPTQFEGEEGLGKSFEALGRFGDATVHFQNAARVVKDNASPAALRRSNTVLAEVENVPDLYSAHQQLAFMLLQTARNLQALGHFRAMVSLRPQYYVAHRSLANVLAMLSFSDEALQEFKKATQLEPTDTISHFNLASMLFARGKLNEALPEFQQCTKLDPGEVDYHVAYAYALIKAGRVNEALPEAQEARRIDPQNIAVMELVSTLYQQTKQAR